MVILGISLTLSFQIVMVGRYSVELVLILLCGMGLHTAEVASIGGPDLFVQFDQVSVRACQFEIYDQSV